MNIVMARETREISLQPLLPQSSVRAYHCVKKIVPKGFQIVPPTVQSVVVYHNLM
jgi:hypothetical protein